MKPNATGEQRPKFRPILHSLYDQPLPTRRLLNWFVGNGCNFKRYYCISIFESDNFSIKYRLTRKTAMIKIPLNMAPPIHPMRIFRIAITSVVVSAMPKNVSRYTTTPKIVKVVMFDLLVIFRPVLSPRWFIFIMYCQRFGSGAATSRRLHPSCYALIWLQL